MSQSRFPRYAVTLLVLFVVVVGIMLLNILIAMVWLLLKCWGYYIYIPCASNYIQSSFLYHFNFSVF